MALDDYKRIVLKIGSAILVEDGLLRDAWLDTLCADIAALREDGVSVLLVSSGAVALGCHVLKLDRAKLSLPDKQACAAVGQSLLTHGYDRTLQRYGLRAAQALLTLKDTESRRRYLNARSALETLLRLDVVPIINENDTVATEELRYGDNDRLAARTAQMIDADALILLSDIDGLYTADPRHDPEATHILIVETLEDAHFDMAGEANAEAGVGSGGMTTKLVAARIATQAGCDMIICDGREAGAVRRLAEGSQTHTLFRSDPGKRKARRKWIAGTLAPSGTLRVDAGAVRALRTGRSLLAAGIQTAEGTFRTDDAVAIVGPDGASVAVGLSAYASADLPGVIGRRSDTIDHENGPVVVHRDNMVMR